MQPRRWCCDSLCLCKALPQILKFTDMFCRWCRALITPPSRAVRPSSPLAALPRSVRLPGVPLNLPRRRRLAAARHASPLLPLTQVLHCSAHLQHDRSDASCAPFKGIRAPPVVAEDAEHALLHILRIRVTDQDCEPWASILENAISSSRAFNPGETRDAGAMVERETQSLIFLFNILQICSVQSRQGARHSSHGGANRYMLRAHFVKYHQAVQLLCRAFNPGEARDAGATVERENRRLQDGSVFYVMDGKQRFTQGYLQRQIAIRSLAICDALPPLDELQRFKQVTSCLSAVSMSQTLT